MKYLLIIVLLLMVGCVILNDYESSENLDGKNDSIKIRNAEIEYVDHVEDIPEEIDSVKFEAVCMSFTVFEDEFGNKFTKHCSPLSSWAVSCNYEGKDCHDRLDSLNKNKIK